VIFVKFVKCF